MMPLVCTKFKLYEKGVFSFIRIYFGAKPSGFCKEAPDIRNNYSRGGRYICKSYTSILGNKPDGTKR